MRAIPSELLERVKKKWQVPAENADPAMKVYLSRGFINELFQVFTIQEGAELTDVDVTVKRTDTSAEPAEAFALAINDGVAQVKSKPLPYDDQIPWVSEFTVASGVSSVAIEFDGYWDRDYATRRFNFVTEEYPWLFYVQGGTLYAKLWEDAEITLATDVVKVCAIRGWLPANGDQSNDQGLIVAYIKSDGLVYYRSYCIQVGGGKLWEVERNVAEVMTAATDLALFRTNDFRIGFLVSISGTMYWLLTRRNWAGLGHAEFLEATTGDISIDLIEIEYNDLEAKSEHLTSFACAQTINYCPYIEITFSSAFNVDHSEAQIVITFDRAVINHAGQELAFTVKDQNNATITVFSTTIGNSESEVVLVSSNFAAFVGCLKITYDNSIGSLGAFSESCWFNVNSFEETFIPEIQPPEGFASESIASSVLYNSLSIEMKKIDFDNGFGTESLSATVPQSSITLTLTHIDDLDA